MTDGKVERVSSFPPAAHPRPKTLPLIGVRAVPPPDIVPARMVNEVLYCERLMYLEWVQGEFADNAYTVEGRFTHARADSPGGKLPQQPAKTDPETEDEDKDEPETVPVELSRYRLRQRKEVTEERPYQARSIWLTSEKLGITAKIDVVEGTESGVVVPIEYKRGAAPDLPEGAYLPERAQVCVQALLLREHGYRCDEGAIYFAKSRQRVAVPITEALVFRTLEAVRTAREVAARSEAPPPLQDSPKCRGCSLVDICLPDEVNLLRALDGQPPIESPPLEIAPADDPDEPLSPDPWELTTGIDREPARRVRQLVTARDDRVPLYVNDYRAVIALSGERLIVRGAEGTVPVRLMNTSQVVIRGNAQISTQALRALLERGIPISFLSGGGYFVGRATGHDTNNIDLRMAQYRAASDEAVCLELARAFVVAKIRNARTMLRRNHSSLGPTTLFELKQLARKATSAESLASLLGIEGAAARVYFQAFEGMLKPREALSFDFQRRNRRPPKDPINAMLSFTYALLVKEIAIAAAGVGLEPLLGFYHQPRFGRPALALDLMEELRPIVADSVVVNAVNTGVVAADDFVTIADACNLKPHARRALTDAFERRLDQLISHPIFGYRISYRRVIEVQARLLARVITGELPAYPPLLTR